MSFETNLYRCFPQNGNLLFSPLSIKLALGRTAVGARGETRAQMLKVLELEDATDQAIMLALASMETSLASTQRVTFNVANRIYASKHLNFVQDYLDLMEKYAGLEKVDFSNDYETVRQQINLWVADQTRQRIQNLLGQGTLDTITSMVLVNAVYFKGDWMYQFDPIMTSPQTFYAPSGTTACMMMEQTARFRHLDIQNFQMLQMPYAAGSNMHMTVILPNKGVGLQEVEKYITDSNNYPELCRYLAPEEVEVHLPRFQVEWGTHNLKTMLYRMGMTDAFGPLADFSGIEPSRSIYVSGVYHKAWGKTDELGSEMAAATAVVTRFKGISNKAVFKADRPFMFVVGNGQNIAFMGRIENPAMG